AKDCPPESLLAVEALLSQERVRKSCSPLFSVGEAWNGHLLGLATHFDQPQHAMTFIMFESLSPPFRAADREGRLLIRPG
ncbi:MAG: hypothetical protein WBX20_16210, partial [Terrimicrobiaceae bacterium]